MSFNTPVYLGNLYTPDEENKMEDFSKLDANGLYNVARDRELLVAIEHEIAQGSKGSYFAKNSKEILTLRYFCHWVNELLTSLAEQGNRIQNLLVSEAEASFHIEPLMSARTHYTGEAPYNGWQGMGLALKEALDERDSAQKHVSTLLNALTETNIANEEILDELCRLRKQLPEGKS